MATKLAAQLGALSGVLASMPSDETFEKVASSLHMDLQFVKLAYLHKHAIHPALLLGGGIGAGVLGAAAWPKAKGWLDPNPEMLMSRKRIWQQMHQNLQDRNLSQAMIAAQNPGYGLPNSYAAQQQTY